MFGEGFTAALASKADGQPTGIRFRSLDGRLLVFDDSPPKEKEGHGSEEGSG